MAIYSYACDDCGDFDASFPIGKAPSHEVCAGCGNERPRRYRVHMAHIRHAEYNPAVGKVISSEVQLRDALKEKSEDIEARSGSPTNLEPVNIHDEIFDPVE